MTTDVVAVGPGASIRDAARLMFRYRVSGVPVVDMDDHVLGIITEGDFLAMEIERLETGAVPTEVREVMSKSVKTIPPEMDVTGAARFIEDEIREDLVRRVLFVDPESIDVKVLNGVVTFVGSIGTRTEARLVEELARRLDGVVDVSNELTWRIDDTDSQGLSVD
jgi:CBS domain-containing protein